ncbi:hypothetical protein [Streptomyces marianii]|uniref:LPXTG cell wall anchor domain-containing protein n=1 Tax=Streptomyces marianii TaxID=1817406 RepID=A0A5R9E2G1_9ACTN|nr:hypothetical protein [Streptomyces marianii]TLQ44090.1 hypothetical protein FEF34_14000 [Streptomyces marianii]
MPVARRPLLTAAAAGSLLCALWFVPSANATANGEQGQPDRSPSGDSASAVAYGSRDTDPAGGAAAVPDTGGAGDTRAADGVTAGAEAPQGGSQGLSLADTGSVDTTPYLVGGTLFLGVGAGFVSYAARRSGGRLV